MNVSLRKGIAVIGISAIALSFSFTGPIDYVYICKGPKSTKYHLKKDCTGLNNCSTDTYKVTLTEAKSKFKRTLCGFED